MIFRLCLDIDSATILLLSSVNYLIIFPISVLLNKGFAHIMSYVDFYLNFHYQDKTILHIYKKPIMSIITQNLF